MLESGVILLFLAPGIAAYAALYGLFHSTGSIAQESPAANSIETITVILTGALLIHLATASFIAIGHFICDQQIICCFAVSAPWHDLYGMAISSISKSSNLAAGAGGLSLPSRVSSEKVAFLLGAVTAQSVLSYAMIRGWFAYRGRHGVLPRWLYGWAASIPNIFDEDRGLLIAYVLTNHDVEDGAAKKHCIAYAGMVNTMKLDANGNISTLTLLDCDRYLVDLTTEGAQNPAGTANAPYKALFNSPFMLFDGTQIRNVALAVVPLPPNLTR
ncbi:MAG: hypothetical protein R3E04_09200 [Sphingobium sp.]